MGYTTDFRLKTTKLPLKDYRQKEKLKNSDSSDWFNQFFTCALLEDGIFSGKWYDYAEQMSITSREYPDEIFILYGRGEEGTDVWREVYQSGVRYTGKTTLTHSEINLPDGTVIPEHTTDCG